jgi:hypothetical protein
VKGVAEELRLDWHTVKELDKLYLNEQLRHAPPANPTVLDIDEISMGHGHTCRIVDWPFWRGPRREGIGRETGLLNRWPASELLNQFLA